MLKLGVSRLAISAMAMLMIALASQTASAEPRATEFKLSNGMDVVVIPDHRAPVVTHMVWYKVGAADEPKGTLRGLPAGECLPLRASMRNRSSNPTVQPTHAKSASACVATAANMFPPPKAGGRLTRFVYITRRHRKSAGSAACRK